MQQIKAYQEPSKLAAPNPKFVLSFVLLCDSGQKLQRLQGKNYRLSLLIICSLQDLLKLENEVDDLMLSGILFHSIIPV